MPKKVHLLIAILPAVLWVGCAAPEPAPAAKPDAPVGRQVPSPALAPGTSAAMNTPGYWIGRHPDPDRLVMTEAEIVAFNERTRRSDNTVVDVVRFEDPVDSERLKADLHTGLDQVKSRGYSLACGRQPDDVWWQSLEDNMGLAAIESQVPVGFGLISGFCDHRVLPTTEGLYREDLDLNFDRLQDSTLDVGAPVAVLHRSRDGRWLYAVGETLRGWVAAESVALCERDALTRHVRAEKFAVVTAAKADLFADERLRVHLGRAQMGTRLAVERDDGGSGTLAVLVPSRNQNGICTMTTAYVQRTDANPGYLPYTARTILNQAFKLLHTPYGWGGLFGEQDCSRFIQEVFATVGLVLPRNSSEQAKVGRLIYANTWIGLADEKRAALREQAVPALTLLRTNGHIMLFLGFVDGRPYILHDLWGYSVDESTTAVVNRVAVTPADLGNSPSGSLLDRVNTIRTLDAPAPQAP
jgi:hypothetical protein